ncbi:HEAT repeat domain-containing protein [Pseudomonas indica]|uniref:HEAT repeat n=1 Tax=Pseudomonas indica TaxID=137658 RepID=A0A1G9BCD7_9PSED|nr:HEAT repeat domain-containing protein [Pseudomonas indica]SDK37143.1 HEAT repeat [Pseudomonas indica]
MTNPKNWLERLKSRPATGNYWQDYRQREAVAVLEANENNGDWAALSTYGNGFIREAAVRRLLESPSPQALAALLERLNDWVPQVRELAIEGVRPYLVPTQVEALLYSLKSLMALAKRQRTDHAPTLAAARAALLAPEVRVTLENAWRDSRGSEARFLFELLVEDLENRPQLLRRAVSHADMSVRRMAVQACDELSAEQAVPLLLRALETPGASVRVMALRALLGHSTEPHPYLQKALLDASAAVRALALWAAPRWNLDPRSVLRERLRLAPPQTKRAWLGVLGLAHDLKETLDEIWLTAARNAGPVAVRLASLEWQADNIPMLVTALNDGPKKVFLRATELLRKQSWEEVQTSLDERLVETLDSDRRDALVRLRPGWQQLAYLLRRLDAASPQDHASTLARLGDWCLGQYLIVDPMTPKPQRDALLARVKELEMSGALPTGCTERLK